MVNSAYRFATDPGRVYRGEAEPSAEMATNAAMNMVGMSGAAPAEAGAMRSGAGFFGSAFQRPSVEPIVTQAGRMGIPLGGAEQMAAAHPSAFGPYATIAPRVSHEDFSATYKPMFDMGDRQSFDPQRLENSLVFPLYGDRTIAGQRVTSINGAPVDVPTFGGPRYPEMNAAQGSSAGWASEPAPIGALKNKIRSGLDQGKDVYGVYTAMSPRSGDQTTMMADALLQQIGQSKISKKDIQAFNLDAKEILPGFPGVQHPDAMSYLTQAPQGARKQIVELMDSAKYLKAGFPDVSSARMALTEPGLLDKPSGASGFSVVKFDESSLGTHKNTLEHPTYPTQIAGRPMGQFDQQVPFDMLYPDFINERRAAGASAGKDLRAFEFRRPSQVVTPEQIDNVMKYMQMAK